MANHHCGPDVRHVIDVRNLYPMEKVPFFDPPRGAPSAAGAAAVPAEQSADAIVRAFHNSRPVRAGERRRSPVAAQRSPGGLGRRSKRANPGRWPRTILARARQLDFTMRTALFEGHLGRGCNAYGACERNIVALSIRNRALERCFSREGCACPRGFRGRRLDRFAVQHLG